LAGWLAGLAVSMLMAAHHLLYIHQKGMKYFHFMFYASVAVCVCVSEGERERERKEEREILFMFRQANIENLFIPQKIETVF